jgi:TonB family protein
MGKLLLRCPQICSVVVMGLAVLAISNARAGAADAEGPLIDFPSTGTQDVGASGKKPIRQVIHSHSEEIKSCYERERSKMSALDGRVTIQFTIEGHGEVTAASIQSSSLGNRAVEQCMVAAVQSWVFPNRSNGNVVVTYPFPRSSAAGVLVPPTGLDRPAVKPKVVPAVLIKKDKISVGDDPHLPFEVKILHPCESLTGSYKVCVEPNGTIGSVDVVQGIPGADEGIISSVKAWRYQPQPLPICFIQFFEFQVAGDTACLAANDYHPLKEKDLSALPSYDSAACGAAMTERWIISRSHASGRTGKVVFRVELDARGTVHKIKIVESFGPEMDAMVAGFLRRNPSCRTGAAIDKAGKPAPFVIERYTQIFE